MERYTSIKTWVTPVLELNEYLKEFPKVNGTEERKLKKEEILGILEFGIPCSWRREMTVQGFDTVLENLKKFIEFCCSLESCKSFSNKKQNPKKLSFQDSPVVPKRKCGKASKRKTGSFSGLCKQHCKLHGPNTMQSTTECFEVTNGLV